MTAHLLSMSGTQAWIPSILAKAVYGHVSSMTTVMGEEQEVGGMGTKTGRMNATSLAPGSAGQ